MSRLLFQGVKGVADTEPGAINDHSSLIAVDEGDVLHEECGVVAIHGHADAARMT